MIYHGYKFRIARNIVTLPGYTDSKGQAVLETASNGAYVRFGRVCKAGGVPTSYTYPDGSPVFAQPIQVRAMSRTNMAHGTDGKVYLAKDGSCYTAKLHVQPE